MHTRTSRSRHSSQSGMTLIELLVAFIIFAFGMLGLAGLQSKTVAYSQTSLLRSQATALSDDILDRMRVDRDNAMNGLWNTALSSDAASITPLTRVYQTDLRDWKLSVESLLPNGKASISVANKTTVTIVITWSGIKTSEGGTKTSEAESWTTISKL